MYMCAFSNSFTLLTKYRFYARSGNNLADLKQT